MLTFRDDHLLLLWVLPPIGVRARAVFLAPHTAGQTQELATCHTLSLTGTYHVTLLTKKRRSNLKVIHHPWSVERVTIDVASSLIYFSISKDPI